MDFPIHCPSEVAHRGVNCPRKMPLNAGVIRSALGWNYFYFRTRPGRRERPLNIAHTQCVSKLIDLFQELDR